MSYDLMVFDASVAPKSPQDFLAWYDKITQWSEGHDYSDPANSSVTLRSWYGDMIGAFPAMNGPDRAEDFDSSFVTDYCIARHAIYCAFAGSVGRTAYNMVLQLAEKHGLGFYDVSGEGEVFGPLPSGYGRMFAVGGI